MKKIILILSLVFAVFGSYAQKMMFLTGKADQLLMQCGTIKDSVQIDRSVLIVKYRFTNGEVWTDLRMQIGERFIKQTDMCLYYDHLIWTTREIQGELSRLRNLAGKRPSNLFSEIICDCEKKEMVVICGDYFSDDAMKKYRQEVPNIVWKQTDQQQTICGYPCRGAVADFGGRTWTVWYTTDLPIAYGPWKLNGLPGLILAASDGRNFAFDCVEITRKQDPIVRYEYETTQDLKNLSNYLRYERNCYEHPYQTFANGEQAMIYLRDADGKTTSLDESWTIPYNPIESDKIER